MWLDTLANYTFSIYIINPLVKALLSRIGIEEKIMMFIMNGEGVWYNEIIYTVVILLVVFLTSLLISFIIQKILMGMKCVLRYFKYNKGDK